MKICVNLTYFLFRNNLEESIHQLTYNNNYSSYFEKNSDKKLNKSCRICFSSKSSESDPFITPCKCSGSMSIIHFNCLKQCLNMKVIKKQTECAVYYLLKNYECEICLTEFPKYIKVKNRVYNLIDIKPPYDEYAILDYILYDEEKHKFLRKGFIVLKLVENEEITIVNQ